MSKRINFVMICIVAPSRFGVLNPGMPLVCISILFSTTTGLIGGFAAWEISQAFLTNWAWLVDHELLRASNFWRAERGEGPLILPDFSGGILEEIV